VPDQWRLVGPPEAAGRCDALARRVLFSDPEQEAADAARGCGVVDDKPYRSGCETVAPILDAYRECQLADTLCHVRQQDLTERLLAIVVIASWMPWSLARAARARAR